MQRFVPFVAAFAAFFFVSHAISAADRSSAGSGPPREPVAESRSSDILIAQSTTPSARDTTRAVQERLTALGYEPGPVDGISGPKTQDAISSFQAAAGLAPDGIVSSELLARLNASLAPAARGEEDGAPSDGEEPGDGEDTTARTTEDGAPAPADETDDFVAAWMLGTWRIDCGSEDPGLVFDRVAFDKTWSDDWTVSLQGNRIKVCRENEGRFCYLYERLSETRMVFAGHEGETARTPRNIQIQKCE